MKSSGGLTKTQMRVLKLFGDGLGTKEIAYKMKISPKTCEYHRAALNRIFGFAGGSIHLARLAIAFGMSALCMMCMAAGPTQPTITFAWDAPSNQAWTGLTYRIYYTTSLATPTNQWPLLTVVTNAVQVGNQLYSTNTLPLAPGNYFFTMTASNSWYGVGVESFFHWRQQTCRRRQLSTIFYCSLLVNSWCKGSSNAKVIWGVSPVCD